MAKALFGHVGTVGDQRLRDEVRRLRETVRTLEFELARMRAENDRLQAETANQPTLAQLASLDEPALT